MTIEHVPRLAYTDDSHIDLAPRPHVDDIAVDTLAAQQKARMAEKRAQGFNGWDDPRRCSPEKLSILMAQSMCKGKVVDVANFAAMLLARNAPAALVGEHSTRAFLLGARECQAATIEALRGHLDRARSLYRAAQGEICSLLHSDAPPNKAKLGELNDYLGFALSSIERLKLPSVGSRPCQHCGGSGREEDVFEQAARQLGAQQAEQPAEYPCMSCTFCVDDGSPRLCPHKGTSQAHVTGEQPAEEARGVDALTRYRYTERDGMVEDRAMGEWVLLDAVKALLAAPAAAEAQPPNEWQDISTAPWSDDLIWLMKGDSIDGPKRIEHDDYDRYTHWAPCQPPQAAHSRQAQGGALSEATQEYTLRAMARNYANGHAWDKLDTEVCAAAADEIRTLRALLAPTTSEPRVEGQEPGAAQFAEWFAANYPGPDTIIHNPHWHAPRIYRAALAAQKKGA